MKYIESNLYDQQTINVFRLSTKWVLKRDSMSFLAFYVQKPLQQPKLIYQGFYKLSDNSKNLCCLIKNKNIISKDIFFVKPRIKNLNCEIRIEKLKAKDLKNQQDKVLFKGQSVQRISLDSKSFNQTVGYIENRKLGKFYIMSNKKKHLYKIHVD